MLNLYFLYWDEPDDDGGPTDHDLLVRAKTPQDAVAYWRQHFIEKGNELVTEDTVPDGVILVNAFAKEGVLEWGKHDAPHVSYSQKSGLSC